MINITQGQFEYLSIQKGDVSDYLNKVSNKIEDNSAWKTQYEQNIERQFLNIKDHIPEKCKHVLDIGSGLGGIDVLIHKETNARIVLLDGEKDKPTVDKHSKTFSNKDVAISFQQDNGVEKIAYITPQETVDYKHFGAKFDLVVSFASYGFHYSTEEYIEFLDKVTKKGTVLIFDIRKGKDEYIESLKSKFQLVETIHSAKKYDRMVFVK